MAEDVNSRLLLAEEDNLGRTRVFIGWMMAEQGDLRPNKEICSRTKKQEAVLMESRWTASEQRRGHITTLPLAKDVERRIATAKAAIGILHRHPYTAPLSDI
ncbi:hypothetical protein LXL04_000506 [Taraxacum kok-saghyz]